MNARPLLPIPISAAGWIATEYGYDQVVIYGRRVGNAPDPRGEHLTTFGATQEHKPVAAKIGDLFTQKVAGWINDGELTLSEAICSVAQERQRQIDEEGWTPEHDDKHVDGEMARAAATYALAASYSDWQRDGNPIRPNLQNEWEGNTFSPLRSLWPWDWKWWNPKDRRRDLVRAAALIVAEIERLDRIVEREGT